MKRITNTEDGYYVPTMLYVSIGFMKFVFDFAKIIINANKENEVADVVLEKVIDIVHENSMNIFAILIICTLFNSTNCYYYMKKLFSVLFNLILKFEDR